MSLEWFSRMENALRLSLPEVCGNFEEFSIVFETDTTLKHPAYIFSVETEDDDRIDFCDISFDPINQELYTYYFDEETDYEVKVLFEDLVDIIGYVEASFEEFLDELEELEEDMEMEDREWVDEEDIDFDLDEIEWLSNDKFIHIEENDPENSVHHDIHFKLGRVMDTGEGILSRHTVTKLNGEEFEETVDLFFKEEEAQYIIDLMNGFLQGHK